MKMVLLPGVVLFFTGLTVQAMHLALPAMPKARSSHSLSGLDKKKKNGTFAQKRSSEIAQNAASAQENSEAMADLLIAAAMRYSGNEKPLVPEFNESIKAMDSLPSEQRWRLLSLMQQFDTTAKNESKESDEQLAQIRYKMHSIDDAQDSKPHQHHAHASQAKHKRGDSF